MVSFKREMQLLEIWLSDNPKRLPKKNWRVQVSNWMKVAEEIALGKKVKEQRRWYPPKPTLTAHESKEALQKIKSIGDILQEIK